MDILDLLLSKIKERYEDVSEDLASGVAKDYADYRYICGVINGLISVKNYVEDMKHTMEDY
tara:strand:+ start:483 stop:665 length:183 start_codon:yes stop_codon:yes gene_type:complete